MRPWFVSAFVLGSSFGVWSCGVESTIGDSVGGAAGSPASGGAGSSISLGGAAGSGGAGGSGGAVGGSGGDPCSNGGCAAGSTGYVGLPCDIQVALSKSCARTGCHSTLDHYGDLDLSNPAAIAAQMVDRPALHGDINCAAPGMPFRECTPPELPATCPPNALLIDSANFENSWVVRKLEGDETCGDKMPLAPGDSVANGWNDARKSCLIEFFRRLASAGGSAGSGGSGGALSTGGAAGIGGAAGTGGLAGSAGALAGAAGSLPLGGAGGTGGTGGGLGSYTPLCDLQQALSKSCARTGCHSAIDHYGGLDLSNIENIAAQVVDKPALHLDINCAPVGQPFRMCNEEELAPLCTGSAVVSTYFVDTQNPENSWMLKKLRGEQGTCGDAMPLPPGSAASNGWNEARRLCIEDFIYYLAGQR